MTSGQSTQGQWQGTAPCWQGGGQQARLLSPSLLLMKTALKTYLAKLKSTPRQGDELAPGGPGNSSYVFPSRGLRHKDSYRHVQINTQRRKPAGICLSLCHTSE